MDVGQSFGSEACLYTEKRAIRSCCMFSVFTSLPTGYGKPLCYACLTFHIEPHLLAPTQSNNNCIPTEQKHLPYGTRPFLLLRRVWLARLLAIRFVLELVNLWTKVHR